MKKIYIFLAGSLLFVVLAACGPAVEDATPTPAETPTDSTPSESEGVFPRPTITSAPIASPTPEEPEGYPAEAVQPDRNPYPAVEGYVWVVLPTGIQCEGPGPYASLKEAADVLREAEITINAETMVTYPVAQACGLPNGEYYRVQIPEEDLEAAATLGWQRED